MVMGLKDTLFFWRAKEDPEAARRQWLLRRGRITEGMITDIETAADGTAAHIFYHYTISNSDFDSSQELLGEQLAQLAKYSPGNAVSVRYNPHQPGNSFVP